MSRKRKSKAIDPDAVARQAVDEMFENLRTTTLTMMPGSFCQPNLDAAFEQIEDHLYRETNDGADDCSDTEMAWRLAGRESGYMIGVQVGLRLRSGKAGA